MGRLSHAESGRRPPGRLARRAAATAEDESHDDTCHEPADVGKECYAALRAGDAERTQPVDELEDEPDSEVGERRHFDQLVEEDEEDERQDPGPREQDDVRAEDR